MIKLLLHESKRRVGSPGVFITPGTYFIYCNQFFVYLHIKQASKLWTVRKFDKKDKYDFNTICLQLNFDLPKA